MRRRDFAAQRWARIAVEGTDEEVLLRVAADLHGRARRNKVLADGAPVAAEGAHALHEGRALVLRPASRRGREAVRPDAAAASAHNGTGTGPPGPVPGLARRRLLLLLLLALAIALLAHRLPGRRRRRRPHCLRRQHRERRRWRRRGVGRFVKRHGLRARAHARTRARTRTRARARAQTRGAVRGRREEEKTRKEELVQFALSLESEEIISSYLGKIGVRDPMCEMTSDAYRQRAG